jgi:hypothetical protein
LHLIFAPDGFDVAYQLAEFVDRHSAHGLLELPDAALEFICVRPWLFRHASCTGTAGQKFRNQGAAGFK